MDLKNLLSTEEDKGKKEAQSTPAPAPPTLSAQPSTPSHYGHVSQQQTPLYAPPSAGSIPPRPQLSQGMTPLRTLSQTQHPFPQHTQTQQSPISAVPGQPYRPFESQQPAPRPGSHGHAYQTAQPLQHQSSYTSISPTPPSHLSRTPSSMRQSPMATMSHLPGQQRDMQQQQQQYSQPNTPLGPPQHYPRAPTYPETHSPYHQRTISNASNGLVLGSPAQHHPGIPNLVESPSAYARPSPQASHSRRPSEYMSQSRTVSRERSISVSPKTKPPPRIPSLGSQQSSTAQEPYNQAQQQQQRTSEQYTQNAAPLAGSPSHVTHQQPHSLVQSQSQQPPPRFGAYTNPTGEVPQQSVQQPMFPPLVSQSSLSSNQASPPQPASGNISHQSEKMGMTHLVTPASEVPPQINGNKQQREGKVKSVTPKNRGYPAPPWNAVSQTSSMDLDGAGDAQQHKQARQSGNAAGVNGTSEAAETAANNDVDSQNAKSLKRPASSSDKMDEPPAKQLKPTPSRKWTERPIWARLSKHNSRYAQQGPVSDAPNRPSAQPRVNGGGPAARDGPTMSHPQAAVIGGQPIDTDMVRIRGMLGDWERSYKNSQPLPDTKRVIADWVFTQLAQLRDVGTDPHYGTVEIEGKIGTLINKDTGERCNLPVLNTAILNAAQSEQFRFESRMQESEHAHMNEVLNKALRSSMGDPDRVKMQYKHFTDIDSFRPLSQNGLNALPPSIRKRVDGRPPRLRTTVRHEKGRSPYVAARIVKVNVGNLQIYSPNDPYDLRISINVEVNLDRPDLHIDDLISEDTKDPQPDRRKDRISYNHLAYQIDLTRVDIGGGPSGPANKGQKPVYELEIEVDANLLRAQMKIAEEGRDCAYGDVVAGFWDNAVILMRERPPQR